MKNTAYNFIELFEGNGHRQQFALSYIPVHKEGDCIDDFMVIHIVGRFGSSEPASGVTLYNNIITLSEPLQDLYQLVVKYNRQKQKKQSRKETKCF